MKEGDINKETNNSEGEENHFGLPKDYFDSFSVRLFEKIADDELKECSVLSSLQKGNPFSVPVGYFESKEELLAYPLLASLKKNKPLTVPANYFENKEEVLAYPILAGNKANSFTVPNAYFSTLTERITDAISIAEEKEGYPLLYSYNKKNGVFVTPDNYFKNFYIETREETAVVPLYKRINKLSYRVAAAVTLLVGLSVLFYVQRDKTVLKANDCNTFACLDKKDILNSGYVLHASESTIIDMIDEDALSDSLSLKKNGKTQKVDMNDVSDNVDINTLTDNL